MAAGRAVSGGTGFHNQALGIGGNAVSEQGRFVTSSPGQLNAWIGRESGKPVQVATPQTDLTSELKRGVASSHQENPENTENMMFVLFADDLKV